MSKKCLYDQNQRAIGIGHSVSYRSKLTGGATERDTRVCCCTPDKRAAYIFYVLRAIAY